MGKGNNLLGGPTIKLMAEESAKFTIIVERLELNNVVTTDSCMYSLYM